MTTTPIRCAWSKCQHGPASHTGGYGECAYAGCECRRYVDLGDVRSSMDRHPSGRQR